MNRYSLTALGSMIVAVQTCCSAQSLSVDTVVKQVLSTSPKAHQAKSLLDATLLQDYQDKPVSKPTLSLHASGGTQTPVRSLPDPELADPTVLPATPLRLSLTAEDVLYHSGLHAAHNYYWAEVDAARDQYDITLNDLAYTAVKYAYNIMQASNGVQQAKLGLEDANQFKTLTLNQIHEGSGKPIDAFTSDSAVASAKSGLLTAQSDLSLAKMALNRLMGRSIELPIDIEGSLPNPVIPPSPEEAIQTALKNRPEIKEIQSRIDEATNGIALAHSEAQPTILVKGEIAEQTPTALLPEHYASAMLEFRWSLLDGGESSRKARIANDNAIRLRSILHDTVEGIKLDVMQSWEQMKEAEAQIELANTTLKSDEAELMVARTAYSVGKGSAMDIASALNLKEKAELSLQQAQYSEDLAFAAFIHAQGLEDTIHGF